MNKQVDVLAVMTDAALSQQIGSDRNDMREARDAVAELIEFAESALSYVDAAADAERARHKANGYPNSQVLAKTVADALRASLRRCGGRA